MVGIVLSACAVLALSLLLVWWAWAVRGGHLPRNRVLGYRSRLTLADDDAWRAVNRATSPALVTAAAGAACGALSSVAIAILASPATAAPALGLAVIWSIGWVTLGVVPAHRVARRLERASRWGR
ncbi:SdpI family protein [Microbacterium hominis]|uniref:SdpI family protein n=1 Tax=Microbacterium hominis TaxID=162426 RepID=UPI0019651040|nr:SdpI family protein [Microbacterium hominis]QRY41016.1 SdpI family protein [Microbacterium hominis]